jgi:hypothetical protein
VSFHGDAYGRADLVLEVAREQTEDVGTPLTPDDRRLSRNAEQRRDLGPHRQSRAVQPAFDCLHADTEHFGYLRRGQPLDVAEQQHLSVYRLECADRLLERYFDFPSRQRVVWRLRRISELGGFETRVRIE